MALSLSSLLPPQRWAIVRLSVRWYIGYDLDEPLPDHSTLSKIRQRYGLEVFRRFFEAIVQRCQEAKLVWGRELYFDSTQVNANADLDSLVPRFAVEAREAIQEHLAALFAPEPGKTENVEASNRDEGLTEHLPVDASSPSPVALSTIISQAQREDLARDNAARHDWIAEGGKQEREAHGTYQRTADLRISSTDPDATPMRLKGGGTHLGYHTHYVVDGGKRRIILAVLVVPGEVMDNQPMLDLLWYVYFRWRVRPGHVTGDTKYGTFENIKAIEDAHIRAYVPLPDWEHKTPYYGPAQFTYDAVHDQYRCPQGQVLFAFHREEQAQLIEYRAAAGTCNACPVKIHCTPSKRGRHLHRSFFAEYQERVKGYHQTYAYQKAMNKRKVWVEPLFAEAKDWHGMRRFRLRRLWRVNCEAQIIAAGQNLKRLLQKRGWGRRPFPAEAATVPLPNWEANESGRYEILKSYRLGIAVAALVSCGAIRTFFEPQTSLFSLLIIIQVTCLSFTLNTLLYCFLPIFADLSLSRGNLRTVKLMRSLVSSTRPFSTGWDVLWSKGWSAVRKGTLPIPGKVTTPDGHALQPDLPQSRQRAKSKSKNLPLSRLVFVRTKGGEQTGVGRKS